MEADADLWTGFTGPRGNADGSGSTSLCMCPTGAAPRVRRGPLPSGGGPRLGACLWWAGDRPLPSTRLSSRTFSSTGESSGSKESHDIDRLGRQWYINTVIISQMNDQLIVNASYGQHFLITWITNPPLHKFQFQN